MLIELSIKNFAIIDDLSIQFSEGLTILSGETGAGKSIIINAVNLLLGNRATSKMIRTGAETAEIEALFHPPASCSAIEILKSQGFKISKELLIQRIISNNDRHRIYINGRISTMQLLNKITENLAAISSQHEHQQLLNESRHLLILDQFGDIMPLRQQVHDCYHQLLPLIEELDQLKESRQKQKDHIELLEFQKKEIEDAGIIPDEDKLLKKEQTRLKNAETLYQIVSGVVETLYSGEGAIAEKLGEMKRQLENASRIDDDLGSSAEGLSDATFRIEDISSELNSYVASIQFDEQRLEEIEFRLDQVNRLKRKYGGTLDSVILHLDTIARELGDHGTLDDRILQTEQKLNKHHEQLADLADRLSKKRRELSLILAKKVEKELNVLKMPNTRFEIAFTETAATSKTSLFLTANGKTITETGTEQACFMIAPNVGEDLKPLSHIASGGELSRVVLALKSIPANDASAGTMIFDEVDAGIGGEVAEVVGKKLSDLAAANQVICITHLAQIAAFGDNHFKISKQIENNRTCTRISPLDADRRLEETARMIGGEKITTAARNHAREMLKNGRKYRPSNAT
ncbi:MAG: DNA repair protein RecN [Desulfobacteraceae bacterium]|nr:DNA repair protein RecN [Desulfobacteraceae bacterium]MBC2757515.1 DNA repair protein RecN [Desulfobacteraceae bacterium]